MRTSRSENFDNSKPERMVMATSKLRLAMFISGGGTTMHAIIEACQTGALEGIDPVMVISNKIDAGGLPKAAARRVLTAVITPASFQQPGQFGEAILRVCKQNSIDLIGQYGWMPLTPANVIEAYKGRMINQHPGPVDPGRPGFGGKGMYGLRVHCARLYFLRHAKRPPQDMWTEAIAQRVDPEFDEGPVLKKIVVPIERSDHMYSLQARVLPFEHQVQIATLADFAAGTVTEITRSEPLVRDDEVGILNEAQRVAKTLFPRE